MTAFAGGKPEGGDARAGERAQLESWVVDPLRSLRRPTFEVRVGDVGVGGDNPIRVQSMTNTDTLDTEGTVAQIERLAEAGCEVARVTAPSIRDAENLAEIRRVLHARGVRIPLVADIHFTPNAAMIAADHVEKVRINPGNYVDKKKFEVREYDDGEYAAELERIADRFRPLVLRCKQNGVAMRIGTNHGSLSDRIMNRFGDTPLGMVESALEFLDVCEQESYREVVFSMKASNTQVAIQAYRLLAARLSDRSGGAPSYPFHVGVTEAGDGEDGRIKSAIGIGSLLEDGIGDTIRVSLTEDPVKEVPVAFALARRSEARWQVARKAPATPDAPSAAELVPAPFAHERRRTGSIPVGGLPIGGGAPVAVELEIAASADPAEGAPRLATSFATLADVECESLCLRVAATEGLGSAEKWSSALRELGVELPLSLRVPVGAAAAAARLLPPPARIAIDVDDRSQTEALREAAAALRQASVPVEWVLHGEAGEIGDRLGALREIDAPDALFSVRSPSPVHAARELAAALSGQGRGAAPVVLRYTRGADHSDEDSVLDLAVSLGAALCDGIGDAVSLAGFPQPAKAVDLAYRVLQGARLRSTRAEYISCPSCGRTLFDLEETTARIKGRTDHLKGVKIAVMGCIVNGPGEMADADFGYVGSGPGTVSLYVGKEVVARHVPEDAAPDRLVELIQERGSWSEPG